MIAVQDIIDRLKEAAPSLGSVDRAIDMEALMASKPHPHGKPLAHVVVMGLRGGEVTSMSHYIQDVGVAFSVILTIPSHSDRGGKQAANDVLGLLSEVCAALCGWGPDDAPGVTTLSRSFVVTSKQGAVVYAVEFTLNDQLRFQ